jgi:hypothetical protein
MDAATDWVVDRGRYALDFDGSDDSAIASSATLSGNSFSVSCWLSLRSVAARQGIFSAGVIGNGIYVDVLTSGVIRAAIEFSGGFAFRDSSAALAQNSLQHVCVSWAGTAVSVYINGFDLTTGGITSGSFTSATISGARIANGFGTSPYGGPCNCLVFSADMFEKPLARNEVSDLYFAGVGGMYLPRRRRRIYSLGPSFNAAWARGSNVILQPSVGVA